MLGPITVNFPPRQPGATAMQYDSLYDLLEAFPDEASCIAHLEAMRWPDGLECAWYGCDSTRIYRIRTRQIYKCGDCRRQFSVRKGTVYRVITATATEMVHSDLDVVGQPQRGCGPTVGFAGRRHRENSLVSASQVAGGSGSDEPHRV